MSLIELSQGWLVALIAVAISAVFVIALIRSRTGPGRRMAGVQRKSRLFSASERTFFESLSDALDYDFHIFAKVGMLEIIERGPKMSKSRFNKLSKELESERFDYVICKKKDLSVAAVIELECLDRRVKRARKQKRTALVSELCKASKLRLFYFDTRQNYVGTDIRRLITGRSKCAKKINRKSSNADVANRGQNAQNRANSALEKSQLSQAGLRHKRASHKRQSQNQSMLTEHIARNACPECHSELVTKVAVKGKYLGERFLTCRKYPYCEYRVPLNDPNVVNICAAKKSDSQSREGFSDWSS